MATQKQKVLTHLQQCGQITSWEAISLYRITRLAAIIWTLRDEGQLITTKMETSEVTGKQYARYFYGGELEL